jgi:hypothetical protein
VDADVGLRSNPNSNRTVEYSGDTVSYRSKDECKSTPVKKCDNELCVVELHIPRVKFFHIFSYCSVDPNEEFSPSTVAAKHRTSNDNSPPAEADRPLVQTSLWRRMILMHADVTAEPCDTLTALPLC